MPVIGRTLAPKSILTRSPALPLAAAVVAILVAVAGRYGYHRDELYFLAAGDELSWGYADQGPLTPLIARAMDELAAGSLTVLRLPSALMTGGIVVLAGLLARELGGSRRAELISAACTAVGVVFLTTGHLLSTTTFDLLAWTALTYIAVRAVRRGEDRLWLVGGVVLGLALLNKPLIAFLAAALLAGVAIAGPCGLIRNPWVWTGAGIALVMWAPWLVWQADHDWPQLDVSEDIAAGGSTSSQPRWAFLPFQILLVSPMLAPVWLAGLVALFRDAGLRPFRFVAWTWAVLAVVFIATVGKPYYIAGLLPVLIAAGAIVTDRWLERGRRSLRRGLLVAGVASSAIIGGTIALPVLPQDSIDPVIAVNPDVGETIGWPEFARRIADAARGEPTIVLTSNYGQAGAIDRFGGRHGLANAYSGHNAYHDWGPPPGSASPVLIVGDGYEDELAVFGGCVLRGRIESPDGIDNDEDGTPLWSCERPGRPWKELWPDLLRLG